MHVRRTLTVVAACAVTSLALVTTAAQATPSATGGNGSASGVKASKFPKIKGDAFYYFCATGFSGCPAEYYFVVKGKTKTWEFYGDTNVGGFTAKYKKNPYTYFYYDEGINEECLLVALKVKGGYDEGGFYCYDEEIGEYVLYEDWYAYK